jgi:cell fate (sporulation/competence/biofilm development) regulator YlbF (YheA/YmcA/DUF963 family)
MNTTWLHATYDLVDEIKTQEDYKRLLELKHGMETDPQLQDLILQFQQSSEKYEDVKQYGKHHPDLKRVRATFARDKERLYTHPIVREYKQLEQQIQAKLDLISKTVATSISSKIKHPNELGLIPKH